MWRRVLGLLVCGLVLYGVAPAVLDVLDAWPQVVDIEVYWFAAMVLAQVLSWASMWLLQRLAVDARSWWPVVTSQLASGALGRVVPGGPAAAGALQYRMLVVAGIPSSLAGIGIGVASIVLLATLAALPVLAIPAVLLGVAVPERLWQAGLLGIACSSRCSRSGRRCWPPTARSRGSGGCGSGSAGGCGRASRRPPTCRNAGATSATSSGRRSDGAGGRPSRAARGAGCSTG